MTADYPWYAVAGILSEAGAKQPTVLLQRRCSTQPPAHLWYKHVEVATLHRSAGPSHLAMCTTVAHVSSILDNQI
jgi:hypothetical protein